MTIPVILKAAIVLWLFHWNGMYILQNIESHPYPSAKMRERRDAIRGLFVIVRALVVTLATIAIIQL